MNRILLPNRGPDIDKVPVAIALGIRECKRVGADTLTIVTPAKNNLDSIVVGDFLGDAVAKKLMKGNRVMVGNEGVALEHESVAAAVKKHSLRVAVAFYVSAEDMIKLDALHLQALIYVPWLETEGVAWASKWNAETHGAQTIGGAIDLPQEVIKALEGLTAFVNRSTGLSHPSDKKHAKDVFSKLAVSSLKWAPEEIEKWAVRNGWRPDDASDLASLSSKYL